MPITIRVPYGGGIGAVEHHSESPEAYFAHTAGLRVVTPSNAANTYRMIQQSVASDDPVIFFEPKRRYWEKGDVETDAPLHAMPLHRARVVDEGNDVTVAAYGPMVATSLEAAESARRRDLCRSRRPALAVADRLRDHRGVGAQDRTTRRRPRGAGFCGLGAEIAARVSENASTPRVAVRRVGGFATPYPPSKLERHFLPDADRILSEVDRCLES